MRPTLLAALVAAAGCGGDRGGPSAQVAGAVTFKGRPVPAGRVYFDPDPAANPAGQQGYADIKDGRYDTAAGGKSPSAGAVTVRVDGFAAAAAGYGPPLFASYEAKAELPAGKSSKDIEVPASAGDRVAKNAAAPP